MLANRQWSLSRADQGTTWVKSDSQGQIFYKTNPSDQYWKPANQEESDRIVAALPRRLQAPTRSQLVMPPPSQPSGSRRHGLPNPHPQQRGFDDERSGYRSRFNGAWDRFRHLEAFGTRTQIEQASLEIWDAAYNIGQQTDGLADELRRRLRAFSSNDSVPFLA